MKSFIAAALTLLLLGSCPEDKKQGFVRHQRLPSGRTIDVIGFHLAFGRPSDGSNHGDDCFLVQFVEDQNKNITELDVDELFKIIRPTCEAWEIKRLEVDAHKAASPYTNFTAFHYRKNAEGNWERSENSGTYRNW
jgi:hypothetical protein